MTLIVVVLGVAISTVVAWILGLIVYGSLPGTVVPGPATGEEGWLSPIKVALTVAAGIGGAVALVVAYRKQRQAERQEHRDVAAERRAIEAAAREVDRAFRDRYGVAVEQLGHPNATVRLAGVYALANLADAWTEQRQQCVDVLCAHLRLPWDHDPADPLAIRQTQTVEGATTTTLTYADQHGEREVRETILRVIGAHLKPDATRAGGEESWSTLSSLNFQGAVLPDLDWGSCDIPNVNFFSATFTGVADFIEAGFNGNAMFASSTFDDYGRFGGAVFKGHAVFSHAEFTEGAGFGQATFCDAHFSQAQFSRRANFDEAQFGLDATFYRATFADHASFFKSVFEGDVDFLHAVFAGNVDGLATSFKGKRTSTGSYSKALSTSRVRRSETRYRLRSERAGYTPARCHPPNQLSDSEPRKITCPVIRRLVQANIYCMKSN